MYFGFHLHFLSHFEDFQPLFIQWFGKLRITILKHQFKQTFLIHKWKAIAQGQKTIHGLKHQK